MDLESFRNATVPDLVGDGCRLLFVGINPGLWTAAVQAHFARKANRFYPALFEAGITDYRIDASAGMKPEDRNHLVARGIGITNIVRRATARADELTADELRSGATQLMQTVRRVQPKVVAVAGITAYRTAFRLPKAAVGRQPEPFAGAIMWVVPNPSGLNAHETATSLARAYREAAAAAGVVDSASP